MKLSDFLSYPVRLVNTEDNEFIAISLSGIQGAYSQAKTYEEALENSQALIIDMFDAYSSDGQMIPCAPKANDGDVLVSVSPTIALKALIKNVMNKKEISQTKLSENLGMSKQALSVALSFSRSNTRFDTLYEIACFLNVKIEIESF